jgi:sigma-B regulation protein RsbU (phosphoserine phosphatase)
MPKEVGGDFYDFFLIDKDRLGLVIGDVSGKGVPAAIFMAVSRTLLKATALKGLPAGECLASVNNLLCLESTASMFVTIFYGIFNTATGELDYANGGHNPPYLLKADGSVKMLDTTNGIALGVMEEMDYNVKHTLLQPGEGLFLYTDGVTEAFNAAGAMYTDQQLAQLLTNLNTEPIKEVVEKVFQSVNEFSTGIDQSDDITILAMRRTA